MNATTRSPAQPWWSHARAHQTLDSMAHHAANLAGALAKVAALPERRPGGDQAAVEPSRNQHEPVLSSAGQFQAARLASYAHLALLGEYQDPATRKHLQRTQLYVKLLLEGVVEQQAADLSLADADLAYHAAALHDIGNVAVPHRILYRQGPLPPKELRAVQRHTAVGRAILRRASQHGGDTPFLRMASDIALHHHEHYDGSGYPHGLRGTAIPLVARVMKLVDVYDAARDAQPPQTVDAHAAAVQVVLQGDASSSPRHLCPVVLSAFQQVHPEFAAVAESCAAV